MVLTAKENADLITNGKDKLDMTAPTITSSLTATAINKNSGSWQVVYEVTAVDNVGVVNYALSGVVDSTFFLIDSETGVVLIRENPDFETKSSYSFSVTASDAAGNTSSPQTVTLAINDVAD